ncbi:dihydroorotate dehydrogenase electron transfer subunit, partial [Lachnotalea glycerini]
MWLKTEQIASDVRPGQFISIYCNEGSRMLPRPISICETDKENNALRVVYRVAGKGTEEFSKYKSGNTLRIMGPLGNGFPISKKKALLIGGGIGIPPMLELAKELDCEKQIVAGYKDEIFLQEELKLNGKFYVATEDGSVGTRGNVMDAI